MMPLLNFLLTAIVIAVIVYVCILLIDMLGLPEPIHRIAKLVIGLIGLVLIFYQLIGAFGGAGGGLVVLR